jgi:hypothetical protein
VFQEQLMQNAGGVAVCSLSNGNAYSGKYPAESYFKQVMVEQCNRYVYDATNVSLREVSVDIHSILKVTIFTISKLVFNAENLGFIYQRCSFDPNILSTGEGLQGIGLWYAIYKKYRS